MKSADAAILGESILPIFGRAGYNIPIGEVPYRSAATLKTEMVPVTINLVVMRAYYGVLILG